jgi:hypothetical protein
MRETAQVKTQLPGFVFQCSRFEPHDWEIKKSKKKIHGTFRHQQYGVLNGLFMVDFDHIEDPRRLWEDLCAKNVIEEWNLMFAFVTSSGHGLKLVMPAKLEYGNLASNQNKFMKWAGVEADHNTKDASRLSFAPCSKDVYYYRDELLTYENDEYIKAYNGKYADGSSDADLFADNDGSSPTSQETQTNSDLQKSAWEKRLCDELGILERSEELPLDEVKERITYSGIPIKEVVNAYFGGKPPVEGTRHAELLAISSDIRYILEFNLDSCVYFLLRIPFVQDLVKDGDDVGKVIRDSFAYKQNRYFPKKVNTAIAICIKERSQNNDGASGDETTNKFLTYGEKFINLSPYFPTMSELFADANTSSIPAILFSCGAMFGTLATRTWYYFYHNPEKMRRLNYEVFVIADPADGKSAVGDLYQTLMAPIMADDKVYNKNINDYKRKIKEHATKSDKNKKEGLVYPEPKTRIHGSRTANNIFIEDMVNNVEEVEGHNLNLHLFTFDAELDSAEIANKGGQWIDKSIFELKAFHNEEDNQQYRNVDSVTGPFNVYWNFIYTGTPFSLSKKITKRNFGSGLSTRLAVLPLCSPKFTMMPLRKKSKRNLQNIQVLTDWAFKMHEVKGELPLWPLVEHCWRWVDNMMKLAKQANDETMNMFIRRVPYYGINVSAPFILMRHYDEFMENKTFTLDEKDKELCSLIMEIQYYTQKLYFSKFASIYWDNRNSEIAEEASRKHVLYSYLAKLPDNFTKEDIVEVNKVSADYAGMLIKRWRGEFLVTEKGRGKNKIISKTDDGKRV